MTYSQLGLKFYIKFIFLFILMSIFVCAIAFIIDKIFNPLKKKTKIISIAVFGIFLIIMTGVLNNIYYKKYYDNLLKIANTNNELEYYEEGNDVIQATISNRVDNKLLYGILGKTIAADYNFQVLSTNEQKRIVIGDGLRVEVIPPTIDRSKISKEDNEKIDKIINEKIDNIFYYIYENGNDNYLVYFFDKDNSFLNQISFYLKVLYSNPMKVISTYYQNYWNIIFVKEGEFSPNERENYNIPYKMYSGTNDNIVDVNKNYERYIEPYKTVLKDNFITKITNVYMKLSINFIIKMMEFALWFAPIILIMVTIFYIIMRIIKNEMISKELFSLLEFIIILYGTTYLGIMSYVIFGTTVDRYVVPMIALAFMGYLLLTIFVLQFFKNNKKILKIKKEKSTKNLDI